jgi:hypothetical protein
VQDAEENCIMRRSIISTLTAIKENGVGEKDYRTGLKGVYLEDEMYPIEGGSVIKHLCKILRLSQGSGS